jgi:hypothetical protein
MSHPLPGIISTARPPAPCYIIYRYFWRKLYPKIFYHSVIIELALAKEKAAHGEMNRQKIRNQPVHSDVYGLVDIL